MPNYFISSKAKMLGTKFAFHREVSTPNEGCIPCRCYNPLKSFRFPAVYQQISSVVGLLGYLKILILYIKQIRNFGLLAYLLLQSAALY